MRQEDRTMPALDPQWQAIIERSLQEILVWVGFGTIVGLTAKAIMPGKDPGGAVATLLMGIVGTVIGCGTLAFFLPTAKITPISLWGFLAATSGAFTLLAFYRILGTGRRQSVDVWLEGPVSSRRKSAVREVVRL
jgi:uncharacterized membrane protein YeaQ/YmgE (transglycosylase-associated protein family)